mgnify:CR=1 FL=1
MFWLVGSSSRSTSPLEMTCSPSSKLDLTLLPVTLSSVKPTENSSERARENPKPPSIIRFIAKLSGPKSAKLSFARKPMLLSGIPRNFFSLAMKGYAETTPAIATSKRSTLSTAEYYLLVIYLHYVFLRCCSSQMQRPAALHLSQT